ncbi:hypothetical protein C2G38_2098384 [Gigaspora rosea]|uniref:Uncharacterized protein n=1 Tax=Gigaspora rosea TaxID=44941 RepID=A0A397UW49_9GLOM|nr:hypothetical protein C2G38_2098384 [Gigaspora rosea]
MKTLNFLYDKMALFLLQHFQDIFSNRGRTYSTAHPPRPELCDSCGRSLVNNNSTVFVCGHGYHIDCYHGKCTHCEEF